MFFFGFFCSVFLIKGIFWLKKRIQWKWQTVGKFLIRKKKIVTNDAWQRIIDLVKQILTLLFSDKEGKHRVELLKKERRFSIIYSVETSINRMTSNEWKERILVQMTSVPLANQKIVRTSRVKREWRHQCIKYENEWLSYEILRSSHCIFQSFCHGKRQSRALFYFSHFILFNSPRFIQIWLSIFHIVFFWHWCYLSAYSMEWLMRNLIKEFHYIQNIEIIHGVD